ncbi:hypothetical protein BVY04_02390 [bacterium M21]|nr:hypothetical protein BVY04_02390 [bacterium M21]
MQRVEVSFSGSVVMPRIWKAEIVDITEKQIQLDHMDDRAFTTKDAQQIEFRDYAVERVARCPHAECKPACKNCTTHCYRKEYKAHIREIMAFASPRMIYHHPIYTIRHLIDSRTNTKGS